MRYNAHDTKAYTLGHPEHRRDYVEHAAAFTVVVQRLEDRVSAGQLDQVERHVLIQIVRFREAYDRASELRFAAADANRKAPSIQNEARQDEASEVADVMGDQLDTLSEDLAILIDEHLASARADAKESGTPNRDPDPWPGRASLRL